MENVIPPPNPVRLHFDWFELCAERLVNTGRELYARGWSPATSSNYSVRLDENSCAITVSGKHKGQLSLRDIMAVDLDGKPLMDLKPSAETLLHTQIYKREPAIGAVLHTHSVAATVIGMELPADQKQLVFRGYELQKAFAGQSTHEGEVVIPVFDNTQDMNELSALVEARMQAEGTGVAYIIRGHGMYTWGENLAECMRHLEALEFLFECELKRWAISGKPRTV